MAGRLDALGSDASQTLRETHARLDRVATETETTLASARETLSSMDRDIHGLAVQLRLSAELGIQEVQTTAQALRLAGDALQESGRALSDPERILYGTNEAALGPGEKP